jgi:drug/metabolite transporter (DMT)-like permease
MGHYRTPSRLLVLGGLAAAQVLFGIGFLASKKIVEVWPPLVWAGVSLLAAAGPLFLVARRGRRVGSPVTGRFLGAVLVLALFGVVLGNGALLFGLRYTTATNAAVLTTLIPLFTAAIVALRGQESLSPARAAGFLVSLAGVLLLLGVERFQLFGGTWRGDLLALASGVFTALFLSSAKPFFARHDPTWATAWIFLVGGTILSLVSAPWWGELRNVPFDAGMLASMVFSVFGATLLAYFLNFWALAHARSSHVALLVYVQPVVALLLVRLVSGEIFTVRAGAASALIFAGLGLGLRRNSRRVAGPEGLALFIDGHEFPLVDVSQGGFAFSAAREGGLLVGRRIQAEFRLPGTRIVVEATVVNAQKESSLPERWRIGCEAKGMGAVIAAGRQGLT